MPMGTRHSVSGVLLEGHRFLVLEVDGGGRWRLDAPSRARQLVGRRVTVVGTRSGFDLLDVLEIHRA